MSPLGHLAFGLAARPAAPKVPLWVLLLATELLDLLCFAFIVTGIEKNGSRQFDFIQGLKYLSPASIPWSHGLLMSVAWSLAAVLVALLIFRERQASIVVGLAVFSHWVLDFIVHPPDLPLMFGASPRLGLGLWSSGPGFIISLLLEVALFAVGLAVYLGARKRAVARVKA